MSESEKPDHRISRRRVIQGIAVGTAAAALAACQPKVIEKIVEVEKEVTKVVEVEKEVTKVVKEVVKETVQVAVGATEVRAFIGFVAQYGETARRTREYNGEQDKVKIIEVPIATGWETKLRAQLDKGAPDVDGVTAHHYFRFLALWTNMGLTQPIEEYMKTSPVINWDDYWADMLDYNNFSWDVSYEGKVYGVPMAVDATAQGYRMDYYDEVGIPSERENRAKTWDEVLDHAIKLRKWGKDQGIWGMYGWHVYHQTSGAIFQSISKDLYTDDGFVNVDSEDFRKTMKIMKAWIDNDVAPNPVWGAPNQRSNVVGQAGKIAQWQSTLGTPGIIQEIWGKAAVSDPMPTLVEPTGTGGQIFYLTGGYLFQNAKYPQETVDWLLSIYGPQNDSNAKVLISGIKWFPVFKSQWEKQIEPDANVHYMKDFDGYFANGKLIPRNLYYEIETATIQKYCELYFNDDLDVNEASRQCDAEMRGEAAKIRVQ